MTAQRQEMETLATLIAEIRDMHREILDMHRESAACLGVLMDVVKELHELKVDEAAINQRLSELGGRLARPAANDAERGRCSGCGAPLRRHVAPAGVLLICPVCGWSEFVNADGSVAAETSPSGTPQGAAPGAWAA